MQVDALEFGQIFESARLHLLNLVQPQIDRFELGQILKRARLDHFTIGSARVVERIAMQIDFFHFGQSAKSAVLNFLDAIVAEVYDF